MSHAGDIIGGQAGDSGGESVSIDSNEILFRDSPLEFRDCWIHDGSENHIATVFWLIREEFKTAAKPAVGANRHQSIASDHRPKPEA